MITNRKKTWKKTRSLSEKSNDIKKQQQQQQPLWTKNIKTALVKSKNQKIDFKNGWIPRNEIFNDTLILLQWKFTWCVWATYMVELTVHNSWWLQRLYYRQNTLSLPRRHRKRVVWKMSRIKNKFFSRRSVDSVRVLLKKKLKERKKKQTRLYVALHFNLFTPRTIYERFEGGNDPRSWINDLSGWKNKKLKNSGLTGNRTLTFAMTARNALDPLKCYYDENFCFCFRVFLT